jgi:hypothetical protein
MLLFISSAPLAPDLADTEKPPPTFEKYDVVGPVSPETFPPRASYVPGSKNSLIIRTSPPPLPAMDPV